MIRKELDPFESGDKFARAGRAAEEQMAFYLKRFFERDSSTHVLNSIRLERDGDAAQVDHLLLHPYGAIIVESKSVQGKIQLKDDGQWIRWYGDNQSKGMASPITQARLQAAFLRTSLSRAAPRSGAFFDSLPFDTLVAISDAGVILWPKSGALAEVCKADQVSEKSINRIGALAHTYGNKALLSPENIEKIVQFFIASHRPLVKAAVSPEASPPEPPPPPVKQAASHVSWNCRDCGGGNLAVHYAHNYFFHCLDCQKNTPIKPPSCTTCGEQERVRKQGGDFFFDCKKCNTTRSFYTNK